MKILRSLILYALAAALFPWAWLREQPDAAIMAWLETFALAHRRVKEIWASS